MTVLPEELKIALESKEQKMKHNWMYSFMPAREQVHDFVVDSIYLVGYCKVCDQTVAALVPHDSMHTVVDRAYIPKWGCVPVDEVG